MKEKLYCLVLFVSLLPIQGLIGQTDSAGLIKYTPEYEFKEGIYISFDDLKKNSPIPKTRIIADVDYNDPYFFDRVLSEKAFYYYSSIGQKNMVSTKAVWGFVRNGAIYIYNNDDYYRITLVGSICHFVSNYTSYQSTNVSPYSGYSYYDRYGAYPSTYSTTEMRQYLLDFQTGQVYDYEIKSLEIILSRDEALYEEFINLSKKKQKKLKFMYVRKFNERNPLYLPKN